MLLDAARSCPPHLCVCVTPKSSQRRATLRLEDACAATRCARVACALSTSPAQPQRATTPIRDDQRRVVSDADSRRATHQHFDAYRNNLNAALAADPELPHDLLVLQGLARFSGNTALRNNGGGFYNHGLFFSTLAPALKATQPSAKLLAAISTSFGSLDDMKSAFRDKALKQFGSGWAWLGVNNATMGLEVSATKNQDNPLMLAADASMSIPILGLDVWEHAYYLEYQNKRAEYIDNFWSVVDWHSVSVYYEHYASQGLAVDWHAI